MNQTTTAPIQRMYKDRIFIMLYRDKEALLDLYNAISGKNYTNPELLEINTLENAVYMTMKNDLSFLIDSRLSLYEHQSTYNPNLPLRDLFYIAELYSVMTKDENLYSTRQVQLPSPHFIIFYNGVKHAPERQILRLSDAYSIKEENPSLELSVIMLNINRGYNEEIKNICKSLKDYSEYTARVREYARTLPIEEAVEKAICECIQEGILSEFLQKNRAEAKRVSIYEYDQEKHMRQEREASWEDGWNEGLERGRDIHLKEQIQKKLAKGKSVVEIAEELEEDIETIQKLS